MSLLQKLKIEVNVKWFGLGLLCIGLGIIVFNGTFNNISVISWQSVLLMEETGGLGVNHTPVASH